jgi:hypothetical protein
MSNIRWRLAMGIIALAATIVLTYPVGASRQLERKVAEIWPNGVGAVADVIWPNGPAPDVIWPNDPGIVIIWPNAPVSQ